MIFPNLLVHDSFALAGFFFHWKQIYMVCPMFFFPIFFFKFVLHRNILCLLTYSMAKIDIVDHMTCEIIVLIGSEGFSVYWISIGGGIARKTAYVALEILVLWSLKLKKMTSRKITVLWGTMEIARSHRIVKANHSRETGVLARISRIMKQKAHCKDQ